MTSLAVVRASYLLLRAFFELNPPGDHAISRALVIGSASDGLVMAALEKTLSRFDQAQVVAYVGKTLSTGAFPPRVTALKIDTPENTAAPALFVAGLLSRKFDATVIIFSGEMGFGRRKLLGLLSGARLIVCFNEEGSSFLINIYDWRSIARHVLWRLRAAQLRPVTRLLLYPLGYVVVLRRLVPLMLFKWSRSPASMPGARQLLWACGYLVVASRGLRLLAARRRTR